MGKAAAGRMREYRARMSQIMKATCKKKDWECKTTVYDNRSSFKKREKKKSTKNGN